MSTTCQALFWACSHAVLLYHFRINPVISGLFCSLYEQTHWVRILTKVAQLVRGRTVVNPRFKYSEMYFPNFLDLASQVDQTGKASACNTGDPGSIPGWGRSPGEGNGNPLQYSCLENSMDSPMGGPSPWGRRVGHNWRTSLSLSTLFCYALRVLVAQSCLTLQFWAITHQDPLSMRIVFAWGDRWRTEAQG